MEKVHGIITRGVGGLYGVRISSSSDEEVLCRARGIFRQNGISPAVGDDVMISPATADDAASAEELRDRRRDKKAGVSVNFVIDEILDRRNLLIRPPIANLDYLFTVIPCASPEPDLLTADKLTVIAENYGIETVVVINKADIAPEKAAEYAEIYRSAGYRVFTLSCATGDGVDELRDYISGISAEVGAERHISGAFAGVSGAGKSTLMTKLFPELSLKAGSVSRKTERGRHTTRHVELYPVNVGDGVFWLADTPGFSMLDFTRFNFFPYDELAGSFREFGDCIGECKYTKCTHLREEGCAVIKKMADGGIKPTRHESYIKIYEEQRSVPEWKRR